MSGQFWLGKQALRQQFTKITFQDINATIMGNKATAKMVLSMTKGCRILLLDNATNIDLDLYVLHPSVTPSADKNELMFWCNIGAGRSLNFDVTGNIGLTFEAGTQIFVTKNTFETVTATTGCLRTLAWG